MAGNERLCAEEEKNKGPGTGTGTGTGTGRTNGRDCVTRASRTIPASTKTGICKHTLEKKTGTLFYLYTSDGKHEKKVVPSLLRVLIVRGKIKESFVV